MAYELVMPRLGWTMEQGTLVEWLKRDGDAVQVGDLIFAVESDKAVNEVEALEAGLLRIPPDSPPLGSVLPIGALIGYIVKPGEPDPVALQKPASSGGAATLSTQGVPQVAIAERDPAPAGSARTRHGLPSISPRAERVAAELGLTWQTLAGSGSTGRIIERDVRAAAATLANTPVQAATPPSHARATPLARKVAHELEVDLQQVAGTLPGKRISRADVESASRVSAPSVPQASEGNEWVPITSVRRIIADRMMAGVHTTAPVTLTCEVDATELVRLRKQVSADSDSVTRLVPSYTDLLAKVCATALLEQPAVNARFQDDGIVHSKAVHIGIATDTDRGLLVPVIRDVHLKSVRSIATESRTLIERARSGHLTTDALQGSTFTITNLGMFGIDTFTPILNLPECAILGVGRIVAKQVVVDAEAERLAIRHMVFLSLTFDHRLIDGAQAARFLQRVRQFVEQPYLWIL
jgi:pyruvate dehydrogenase E2 component (dihydrolipoamide acetyltransferase)